jgi:hypothetical protein
MAHEMNQDQWNPSDSESVVLGKMGISTWDARKLIAGSGFEFRYVDPDVHPRPGRGAEDGLIFGHKRTHDRLFAWFEAQLLIPVFTPVEPPIVVAPVVQIASMPESVATSTDVAAGKGAQAYARRLAGEQWSDIGVGSNKYAKAYAKARDLPWPPAQEAEPEPS